MLSHCQTYRRAAIKRLRGADRVTASWSRARCFIHPKFDDREEAVGLVVSRKLALRARAYSLALRALRPFNLSIIILVLIRPSLQLIELITQSSDTDP